MLQIVYIVGGVAVLLVVVFVIVVATRPDKFRLERSALIKAPTTAIFPLINDFREWTKWSPWEKLDPVLRRTYSGAALGVGAVYDWTGNKKVGQGRMTLLESRPTDWISIKLEFIKPFTATNICNFKLEPATGGTRVIWSMEGTQGFMSKAFGLLMNMDKLVGKDFERGLANLAAVTELQQAVHSDPNAKS